MQALLNEILDQVRPLLGQGKVADYIPALAEVPAARLGIAVMGVDGSLYTAGDAAELFSIQSISKVFMLTLALNSGGADSLELMPVSGIFIAFNSDDVIIDQNGDCYLAGPGIIFALEDGDIVSLAEEDKKLITQVLEDGTAELTNGAEIRCAFGL